MRELDEKKRKSAEVLRAKKEAEARLLKEAEARQKEAELQASRARVELTKKARKEAQLQQQKEVTVQRKRAQSDHTIKRRSANSSATRDKTDEPSNRERTERAAASHRRRQENVARLEESIAALEKRRAEAAAEAAARNSERQLEQKQWATTVEQRVDDNIEDEPARATVRARGGEAAGRVCTPAVAAQQGAQARLGKVSAGYTIRRHSHRVETRSGRSRKGGATPRSLTGCGGSLAASARARVALYEREWAWQLRPCAAGRRRQRGSRHVPQPPRARAHRGCSSDEPRP